MQDLRGANQSKERILSTIRMRGPSLPVQIAKAIGFPPLFASAFLSELKAEGKVKISNMRVGSSPLYFISGQEEMLERFYEHLNQREREAFSLLKSEQILNDEKQEPVIRVALRALKDFAIPVRVKISDDSKLFWKFFSVSDSDVGRILSGVGEKKEELDKIEKIVKKRIEESSQEDYFPLQEERVSVEVEEKTGNGVEGDFTEKKEDIVEEVPLKKVVKKDKKQESEFGKNVKDFLLAKDIEVLEVLSERKKDFEAKVRIDTLFGKQVYYLVAKDKKSFTDNDLAMALQKAQFEKLLALGMSSGELHKKGKEYLKEWGNLVKFERLLFR